MRGSRFVVGEVVKTTLYERLKNFRSSPRPYAFISRWEHELGAEYAQGLSQ